MKKTVLISVVTGILALFVGFFGGQTYQKSKQQTFQPNSNRMGMVNGTRTGTGSTTARDNLMKNNAPVSGKIIKMDSTSITVQTADGSNKIVLLSDSTVVNKTSESTKADLKEGVEVLIIGTTTNGAVTAKTISLGGSMPQAPEAPTAPNTQDN